MAKAPTLAAPPPEAAGDEGKKASPSETKPNGQSKPKLKASGTINFAKVQPKVAGAKEVKKEKESEPKVKAKESAKEERREQEKDDAKVANGNSGVKEEPDKSLKAKDKKPAEDALPKKVDEFRDQQKKVRCPFCLSL